MCSLRKDEGERQAAAFLKRTPGAVTARFETRACGPRAARVTVTH